MALPALARGQDPELYGKVGLWSVRVWTPDHENVYFRLTGPTEASGYYLEVWCYGDGEAWQVDRGDAWRFGRREGGLRVRLDDGPEERWDLSADESGGVLRGFNILQTVPPELRLNPGLATRMRTAGVVTFRREGHRESVTLDLKGLLAAWHFASTVTGQCPLSRAAGLPER